MNARSANAVLIMIETSRCVVLTFTHKRLVSGRLILLSAHDNERAGPFDIAANGFARSNRKFFAGIRLPRKVERKVERTNPECILFLKLKMEIGSLREVRL